MAIAFIRITRQIFTI